MDSLKFSFVAAGESRSNFGCLFIPSKLGQSIIHVFQQDIISAGSHCHKGKFIDLKIVRLENNVVFGFNRPSVFLRQHGLDLVSEFRFFGYAGAGPRHRNEIELFAGRRKFQ